jgi:hypothetical protein
MLATITSGEKRSILRFVRIPQVNYSSLFWLSGKEGRAQSTELNIGAANVNISFRHSVRQVMNSL